MFPQIQIVVASIVVAIILYFAFKYVHPNSVSAFGAVSDQEGYTFAPGIYFANNTIKGLTNTTPSACKTECDANSSCVGFLMNEGTKECALKSKKENLGFDSKYTWYDKITLKSTTWSDEADGAKSLPTVLADNKLASYVASPVLKQLILGKISEVSQLFKESLSYMVSANSAKLTNVAYDMASRMLAARIVMFGIVDVAQLDGTRESRASIVPPKDASGITRLQFNGKLYGFTIDQLMPYSSKSTGFGGTYPAETVDDALNYELYRCKLSGKNCGVVEPLRCDTVNAPVSASDTDISQCDTTSIYGMYADLEREFNTYMARTKGVTSSTSTDMTSSTCSVDAPLWATQAGGEVMMCPLTHMNYSTNLGQCTKNGVNEFTTGAFGVVAPNMTYYSTAVAPCAKYYNAFAQGAQFYTPDRTGKDAAAWNPLGGTTKPTEIAGRLLYPNTTSMPVWGRA